MSFEYGHDFAPRRAADNILGVRQLVSQFLRLFQERLEAIVKLKAEKVG